MIDFIGRSGEIRTPDPLLPKQVRYQAALRSARPKSSRRRGSRWRVGVYSGRLGCRQAVVGASLSGDLGGGRTTSGGQKWWPTSRAPTVGAVRAQVLSQRRRLLEPGSSTARDLPRPTCRRRTSSTPAVGTSRGQVRPQWRSLARYRHSPVRPQEVSGVADARHRTWWRQGLLMVLHAASWCA